ncbi:MAG: tetratricopeptide repeat protein [Chryseobacterium sp.]|nr:tetratricopeptide repeat protein [Chryseobacterium sp.]MBP7498600.1 tetratricopeptide repeat protein [Chryseobacterium sp.]
MKTLCLSIALTCLMTSSILAQSGGQKPTIEMLTKNLASAKQDSSKSNILFKISYEYLMQGDFPQTINFADRALKLAQKSRFVKGETQALTIMADSYLNMGDFTNAEKNHKKSLAIYEKVNDKSGIALANNHLGILRCLQSNYPEAMIHFRKALSLYEELEDSSKIADMHDNMTQVYINQGNYAEALKHTYTSLKINEKLKNKQGQSVSYNNLGMIYSNQKKYDESLKSFEKSIEIDKEVGNVVAVLSTEINIGVVYGYQKKYDLALKKYLEALKVAEKLQHKDALANIYGNLGDVYHALHKNDLALENFKKAILLTTEMGDMRAVAGWQGNIGRLYNHNGQPKEALKEFEQALAISKEVNAKEVTRDIYLDMSKSDSMLGNYKNAFENYKQFAKYKDSLFNEENTTKLVTLQKDYEFSKKEDELKTTIEARKKENWFYIAGILALATITGLLIYQRKQRKKLNEQQLDAQRKEADALKEIDLAKTRFLTNITHEFRTPLTLIKGNVELIKKGNHLPENDAYLNDIDVNGDRLLGLINKLLDLSKLESGKYQLNFEKGNLINEMQNLVAMFDSAVQQKSIDLSLNIDADISEKLQVQNYTYSSDALHTIINNLLSNAIKFTKNSGAISVSMSLAKNQKDSILIRIKDNGIGIPKNQLNHVFDLFYQVEDFSHQQYIGSGVGLSLVKELAVLHGGSVTVESEENQETTFEVSLYLGNDVSENVPNKFETKYSVIKEDLTVVSEEILTDTDSELPLVLVVEDNPDVSRFIKECLKDNFRIIDAKDGNEGFKSAKTNVPDLIISDVMMPNTDGIKLSTLLKENEITSHIPIILLTAKSGEETKLEGLRTGADDYLTKPFSVQELILRVNNLIRLRKILRQKFSTSLLIKPEEMELDSRDKVFIDQLIKNIENNISDSSFGVEQLADKINLSASQLNRKLRAIAGQSTLKFIQNIRLQKAFEMLKANSDTIAGVAYDTGFESAPYFTKVFKKHFGFLPSEVEKSVEILN